MQNKNKYNVLCLLDDDHGRDLEMILPLIYFAEKYLNCNVEFAFLYDIHAICRKKPDLLLLPNTIGSRLHFRAAKYAYINNIKVFALISEGNFRTDGTFNYFGYNTDRKFYQEYICHWSERTKTFFDKEVPATTGKNVLTGATGFDRYIIYSFLSKKEYLKAKGLEKFNKVVGYAGWAFGKAYNPQGREELATLFNNSTKGFKWVEEQMFKVEEILKSAIETFPDILFILKRHPNEANPTITREYPNEMIRLRKYPNVLYITGNENLHDLISVCDFWCAFESTTAMEAWLMNKQTLFLNPDPDFNRDTTWLGTPVVKTPSGFINAINHYYSAGEIEGFEDRKLAENRARIIRDTIGFSDGCNHLRAAYYLKKTLSDIHPGAGKSGKIKLSLRFLKMHLLLRIGVFLYNKNIFLSLPKFRKTVWIFEKWRLQNVHVLKNLYSSYFDSFYKKNGLHEKISDESIWTDIGIDSENL